MKLVVFTRRVNAHSSMSFTLLVVRAFGCDNAFLSLHEYGLYHAVSQWLYAQRERKLDELDDIFMEHCFELSVTQYAFNCRTDRLIAKNMIDSIYSRDWQHDSRKSVFMEDVPFYNGPLSDSESEV